MKYFSRKVDKHSVLSIGIKEVLYSHRSSFQEIQVVESYDNGRLLILDGVTQLSQKHQYIFSEMATHPSMFALGRQVKDILVLGGGDGGTATECIKHPDVKTVTVCELDPEVIYVSKEYFPFLGKSFSEKRVHLVISDAQKFLSGSNNRYNIIINDLTDPVGPAAHLYSREFYTLCRKRLHPKRNCLIVHAGNPFQDTQEHKQILRNLNGLFRFVQLYLASIPTYRTGLYSLIYASNTTPLSRFHAHYYAEFSKKIILGYYNREVHLASQALPEFIKTLVHDVEFS